MLELSFGCVDQKPYSVQNTSFWHKEETSGYFLGGFEIDSYIFSLLRRFSAKDSSSHPRKLRHIIATYARNVLD